MRQARQDGRGWINHGPSRLLAARAKPGSEGRYKADLLGSRFVIERFARFGLHRETRGKATAGRPNQTLRQLVNKAAVSDIANPLREARIRVRAKELIDTGMSGRLALNAARRGIKT